MLWGRAASRCSFPECRKDLVVDAQDADTSSLVGEAAHIVAEQSNGPRGQSKLPLEQRNNYKNLILLCRNHHKQVDDQVNDFTVEKLLSIKSAHENWVRSSLTGFDPIKQEEDELWAGYIEEWTHQTCLEQWKIETSCLMEATPAISVDFFNKLMTLREWLLSRIWPKSSPKLKISLENFRRVINDLLYVFNEHVDSEQDETYLYTKQFYKLQEWDDDTYSRLLKKYRFHVDLIHDLTFEMTRAANFVCDNVRSNIDKNFRLQQGALLLEHSAEFKNYTSKPEYSEKERQEYPYPGLEKFMDIRIDREHCIGKGQPPE